ncbi:PREDICTED: LOW QUALITY PROTEIN [Prunus dulcis]|uniref:PREDICTED: LOW QUALITY PROTEIN n=1 Tax=Prunus dulcis TaxID=3755 RepID=A0A5E4FVT2_PRUDU|nr:PREDICTED: LOW QUALITY PROTEIN [Prunus dulcis]
MTDKQTSNPNTNNSSNPGMELSNPYYVHPSYHPGHVLVSEKLDGANYSSWSKSMLHALRAKNKIGFIDGSIKPPSEDEKPAIMSNNASCRRNNANNCHPTIFLLLPRHKPTLTCTAIIATARDTPSIIATLSNTIVTFVTKEDIHRTCAKLRMEHGSPIPMEAMATKLVESNDLKGALLPVLLPMQRKQLQALKGHPCHNQIHPSTSSNPLSALSTSSNPLRKQRKSMS